MLNLTPEMKVESADSIPARADFSAARTAAVDEFQGMYGPFAFPETLLQTIWLRGEFDLARAVTVDGRPIEVVHPGRWNRLGGPDFKGARFKVDGVAINGDVELHLRAGDWRAHGHARDSAYDQVVLHVVLLAGGAMPTIGAGGKGIPVLVLLPLLLYSLEDYAADAAVERMANRSASRALEEIIAQPKEERFRLLRRHATNRWRLKVHFASLRVARLGWTEACHQTALEIFGYRFNRAPMLRIAGKWPHAAWSGATAPVNEAYAHESGRWSVQGVRPANRPMTRLHQYAGWASAQPDWPQRWEAGTFPDPPDHSDLVGSDSDLCEDSRAFRDAWKLTTLRHEWGAGLCGDALRGPRLDTLICNALLPFRAAHKGNGFEQAVWYHWFTGDLPPHLVKTLQQLDLISHRQPLCHGLAQGLLGWWIEREQLGAREVPSS